LNQSQTAQFRNDRSAFDREAKAMTLKHAIQSVSSQAHHAAPVVAVGPKQESHSERTVPITLINAEIPREVVAEMSPPASVSTVLQDVLTSPPQTEPSNTTIELNSDKKRVAETAGFPVGLRPMSLPKKAPKLTTTEPKVSQT
jgi:hypothetical protein